MSDIYCKNDLGKLFSMESIFKWKPVILEEYLHLIDLEPQEENEFNFMNFVISLVKCYYLHSSELDTSIKLICEMQENFAKFNCTENNFYGKIKEAIIHVTLASKSTLLLMKKKNNEALELIDEIKSVDEMNLANKAAINAIRSAVFALYSEEEMEMAMGYIDKALTLDPENSQWIFLRGFYVHYHRLKMNPHQPPTPQEKEIFEKALKYDPTNVVYMLYVADVYCSGALHALGRQRHCVNFLPENNTLNNNIKDDIEKKFQLAKDYYNDAVTKYAENTYVMFRSASGFVQLPLPHKDLNLAKKLVHSGLKKDSDSSTGNMLKAKICSLQNQFEPALVHLEKCRKFKIFSADLNVIQLTFTLKGYKCAKPLEDLIEKYKDKYYQAVVYSQLTSYYMFIDYDLAKCCEYAKKFYELSTKSTCMQVHRCIFFPSKDSFSLIDVLIDEIKFTMFSTKISKEKREMCENFLHFIQFQNVPVLKGIPQNFRKQILEGKPMFNNPKCVNMPPRKNAYPKNIPNQRFPGKNTRNDMRNIEGHVTKPSLSKQKSTTSSKEFFDHWRRKNPTQNNAAKLQSLLDLPVLDINKVELFPEGVPTADVSSRDLTEIEKNLSSEPSRNEDDRRKERLEKNQDTDSSSEKTKLIEKLVKIIKKGKFDKKKSKKSRRRKSSTASSSEDDLCKILRDRFNITDLKKKSDSESDSHEKKKHCNKKYRKYSDSDSSSEYSDHRRHHRRNRHKRDYSPRGRRGRRSDSDSEYDYKYRYRRDDRRSADRQSRRDYSDSDDYKYKSRRHEKRSSDRQSKRNYSPENDRDRHHKRREDKRDSVSSERRGHRDRSLSREKRNERHRSAKKTKDRRRNVERDDKSPSKGRVVKRDRSNESRKVRNRSQSVDRCSSPSKKEREGSLESKVDCDRSLSLNRSNLALHEKMMKTKLKKERDRSVESRSARDRSQSTERRIASRGEVKNVKSKRYRDRRSVSKERLPSRSDAKKSSTRRRRSLTPSSEDVDLEI